MSQPAQDRVRVLVVDDNQDNANSLATLLRIGYQCNAKACMDGLKCIETVREFKPHLMFLDLHMPRMDGYQIAQHLAAEGIKPPLVVALTGIGGEDSIEMALNLGCDAHELKPIAIPRLEQLVAKARDIAQLTDESP